MKKLVLAITLAVVLIGSVVGATIVAGAPRDNKPPDVWDIVVDGLSETARIASAQGTFTLEDNTDATFYLSDEYAEGAHFDVTIHIEEEGGGDWVEVWEYYGDGSLYNRAVYNYPDAFYLTSDARQLELKYHSSSAGSVNLTVYWGVTVTYAAHSLAGPA